LQRRTLNGKDYIFEESLLADVAIIKAQKADTKGNLRFNLTARNFNPDMARGAKLTICETEEVVFKFFLNNLFFGRFVNQAK